MTKNIETYEQKTLKFKFIAVLYFPLQYFLVRFLLLGTQIQPSLLEFYNGFNLGGIATVILDFIKYLPDNFTAENYIFLLANIIPYLFRLAWELRFIALYVYVAYELIIFIKSNISILKTKPNLNNVVTVKIGMPGCGKSSSAIYEAVLTAKKMWADVQYKYWEYKSLIGKWKKDGNIQKILEWYEIRDTYEYYITNECIPCLWSNIPLMVDGQNVSVLNYDNASQNKKIPSFSVLFFDEVGSIFTTAMSKDKPLTVADFFRLCRHFGDFRIICTEQDAENIYIDVRRVVSNNIFMIRQKKVNKPLFLNLIYCFCKSLLPVIYPKGNKKSALFLRWFRLMISFIGAREYRYINQGNTQNDIMEKRERIKKCYLPPHLNAQYDDRTFKNLYLAKDITIDTEIFKTLQLQSSEKNKKKYLKCS